MKSRLLLFCLTVFAALNAPAAGSEECTSPKTTVRFESVGNDFYNVTAILKSTQKAYKTIPNLKCKFTRDGSHTFFCHGRAGQQGVTVRSMYTAKQFMTSETSPVHTAFRYTVLAEFWRQDIVQFEDELLVTPEPLRAVQCSF